MNIQVLHNGDNILDDVISYARTQSLCSGIGVLELIIDGASSRTFVPYDIIEIYEDSIKKGTYYLDTIDRQNPSFQINITAQDSTKKLSDYFISERYEVGDAPTRTKYWLEKILDEVPTLAYNFDAPGNGYLVNNNDAFGLEFAIEDVTRLSQQSGWFFYADKDGVIRIDKINESIEDPVEVFTDTEIISLETEKHDKDLRNKVLVWGSSNSSGNRWVFSKREVYSPYQKDENDIRTAVMLDGRISEVAQSDALADSLIKELEKITYIKRVQLEGFYDVKIGDVIGINSYHHSGNSLVTSIQVDVSSDGAKTTLILDERCPRIFGFYSFDGYVYIGTLGSGVWRKPLKYEHIWEDFSQGLTDLNIVDLYINDGVYACVSDEGNLFLRSSYTSGWSKFIPSGFYYPPEELLLPATSGFCRSVSINRATDEVLALYTLPTPLWDSLGVVIPSGVYYSWLTKINGSSYDSYPIVTSGVDRYHGFDLDHNEESTYILAFGEGDEKDSFKVINKNKNLTSQTDTAYYIDDITEYDSFFDVGDEKVIFYHKYEDISTFKFYRKDLSTGDIDSIAVPLPHSSVSVTFKVSYFNKDEIVVAYADSSGQGILIKVDFNSGNYVPISTFEFNDWSYELFTIGNVSYLFYLKNRISEFKVDLYYKIYNNFFETISSETKIELTDFTNGALDGWGISIVEVQNKLIIMVSEVYNGFPNYLYKLGIVLFDPQSLAYTVDDSYDYYRGERIVPDYYNGKIYLYISTTKDTIDEKNLILRIEVSPGLVIFNHFDDTSGEVHELIGGKYTYRVMTNGDVCDLTSGIYLNNISIGVNDIFSYTSDFKDESIYKVDWVGTHITLYKYTPPFFNEVEIYDDNSFISRPSYPFINLLGERFLFGNGQETSRILQQNAQTYIDHGEFATGYNILKESNNTFEVLSVFPTWGKVETSKTYPIVVYGGNDWSNAGYIYNSMVGRSGLMMNLNLIPDNYFVSDTRVFDIVTESGSSRCLLIASKNTISGYSNIKICDFDNILTSGWSTSGVIEIPFTTVSGEISSVFQDFPIWTVNYVNYKYQFSGYANHIETTNLQYSPYFFVSISGTPPVFYQKDGYDYQDDTSRVDTDFEVRITNIPDSEITVIRCDDRI